MARDDLSGWVEVRALAQNKAKLVAKFLWEDVICRHSIFGRLIVDGGAENKAETIELLQRLGIKRAVDSAYHPQTNEIIERVHKPIVDALTKMSKSKTG